MMPETREPSLLVATVCPLEFTALSIKRARSVNTRFARKLARIRGDVLNLGARTTRSDRKREGERGTQETSSVAVLIPTSPSHRLE